MSEITIEGLSYTLQRRRNKQVTKKIQTSFRHQDERPDCLAAPPPTGRINTGRILHRVCKTYCNTVGSCTPHLPLISAYGHQQYCCPDHIMLQRFGPHSALGRCQVTKDSLTICILIPGNRSNSTVHILYSRHTTAPAASKLAHYYLCLVQMKYFSRL